jgi:type II secretory pathway pseudopilin PulG
MLLPAKFQRHRQGSQSAESGYILVTLMLIAALVVIALAAALPQISQQLRRDREEELIHRGVQYSRAIRRYYKRFGRYPVRLEDLDNTNNIRFIRKRYKDPITGEDFNLLHFGQVKMAFGPGIAGGVAPGANPRGGLNTDKNANQSGSQNQPANQPSEPADQSSSSSSSSSGSKNQTFGGGPIVGVVSTSTRQSIREFNKKNHYNDWQFIYDPSTDRGGLLNTPAQPALQNPAAAQSQPGVQGVPTLGGGQPNPQPQQPQQPPQQ